MKRLAEHPGRVLPETAAAIIGFRKHDMRILAKKGLVNPLGNPANTAVKYYARLEIEKLARDPDWLCKATRAVSTHWAEQNQKRKKKGGKPPTAAA